MSRERSRAGPILVTGGAGYLGSALVSRLLQQGRQVRVFDPLLYGREALAAFEESPNFELIASDPLDRAAVNDALDGVATVVHLGALVGDPVCAIDPDLTHALNMDATALLAEEAKRHGLARFVFASTCSVYGAGDRELDENASLDPKSLYAASKIEGERIVLGSGVAEPVVLRFGTVFGDSPRPRFDLVVNLLTAKVACGEPISIHGGAQWRPFAHVQDIVSAILLALDAEAGRVAGEAFNVGSAAENRQLSGVGEIIAELVPDTRIRIDAGSVDRRDYRANFDKIHDRLGFDAKWTLRAGIEEMLNRLTSGAFDDYRDPMFHNDLAIAALETGSAGKLPRVDKITAT